MVLAHKQNHGINRFKKEYKD